MNASISLTPEICSQIIENLHAAIVLANTELDVIFMNGAAEELFGTSLKRQLNLQQIFINGGSGGLKHYLQQQNHLDSAYTYSNLFLTPLNAAPCSVNCTITRLQLPTQNEILLLIEFHRLGRASRIAQEEQRVAEHHAARAIARGLAHEINNPLGGLRGAAQLLERTLPEAAREYTRIIISETDRLKNLIKNMLGPDNLPNKTAISIHEVLQYVIKLVQAEVGIESRLKIQQDYDPSIPSLYADREQLIQAILNIMRNAWQAVSDNGQILLRTRVLRHISIGQNAYKLVAKIEIIDDGSGISADELETIFYPMVTHRAGGTGLGLTIAQSLINLHDGLIECESKPGNTVFTILIPIIPVKEE